QIFNWFNIKIKKKEEMIKFFQNFQNQDGGFGSILVQDSGFTETIHTIKILNLLKSKPINSQLTINWLNRFYHNNHLNDLFDIFHYINSLIILSYKFSKEFKIELIDKLSTLKEFSNTTYENKYYYIKSLLLLKQNINNLFYFNKPISNNPKENYYIVKLLLIYNKINSYKTIFYNYIKKNELIQGGFCKDKEGIITNGFMINSLYLLDSIEKINRKQFIKWLINSSNNDGWGHGPNMPEYHEYTVSSLISLRLLDHKSLKNKNGILKKAYNDLETIQKFSDNNNYYVLRTIKNSIEKLMLLNSKPNNLLKLRNIISKYYCKEGGFGSKNKPYLYATFWGIRSLYLCETYMEQSKKIFISHLNKINKTTTRWINSCQNEDGGYGPMPKQSSNIQSTFCAYYSLWMLNQQPKNKTKSIEWLINLQKEDGGFAGHKTTESEMLHILYVIGSLVILNKN
ncbi:hypothetical protein HN415_00115, partial [Candidatus Woesearchaeota archaeon]|nr:hypothetical protein [Candidatus Woesearchaeota archaeon]